MILDALANWPQYSALPAWKQAFGWLEAMDPGIEPGEYPIQGRDIFAIVFDTTTKALLDTFLEAHRVYADIHLPLSGPEVHARFSLDQLEEAGAYDEGKDSTQYRHPDRFMALFTLQPGQFVLYLPQDAHLTQGKTDPRPLELRKVVVKLRAELLRP